MHERPSLRPLAPLLGVLAGLAGIVLGAVASRPLEADRAAALLEGQTLTDEAIGAAATTASEIAKRVAAYRTTRIRADLGTDPGVYYRNI